MPRPKARPKCLHCKHPARRRGLCESCYRAAWRTVRAKRSTWKKLEAGGLVLPAREPSGFHRAFEAAGTEGNPLTAEEPQEAVDVGVEPESQ